MRRVNFDYGNTCPKIDKAIDEAKDEIEKFIIDLLDEASPLLDNRHRNALAKDYADSLYRNIEDAFESARKANEDMRGAADDQISDLKDEIESLNAQVSELEKRLEALA